MKNLATKTPEVKPAALYVRQRTSMGDVPNHLHHVPRLDGRTVCGRRIEILALYVATTPIARELSNADFRVMVKVCRNCDRMRHADTIAPFVLTVSPC